MMLTHLKNLYTMLSEANTAILHMQSPTQLFEEICRIAVNHGHLGFAMIMLQSDEGTELHIAAAHGDDREYLKRARFTTDDSDPLGLGPSGRSIRDGKIVVCNDFLNDPITAPWHAVAREANILSSVSCPIYKRGKVIGALGLYAHEIGFFTNEMTKIIYQIASSVSFALDHYQTETERIKAEEDKLRVLARISDAFLAVDKNWRVSYVNYEAGKLLGRAPTEMLDKEIWQMFPEAVGTAFHQLFEKTLKEQQPGSLIEYFSPWDRWFDVRVYPAPDGLTIYFQDISNRMRAEKARAESQQLYMELVDKAADPIWLRRPGGELVIVNDACCRMLGYSREILLKMNIQEILHPGDMESLSISNKLHLGESIRIEHTLMHKDGHIVPVEANLRRLNNGDILSILRDVTERKNTEKRFRTMLDAGVIAMLLVTPRGSIVMANKLATELFGYSNEELCKLKIETLIPERYRPSHKSVRKMFMVNPAPRPMAKGREVYGLRKDGGEVPLKIGLQNVANGGESFVLVSAVDISEAKRAKERFRIMVESSPSIVIVTDNNGNITHLNTRAEDLLGYSRGELLGKPIEVLLPESSRRRHPRQRDAFMRNPSVRNMGSNLDLNILRKDGNMVPVDVGLNPITVGDAHYVLATIVDLRETMRIEAVERAYTQNLKLLSHRIIQAQDSERRQLARELHDEFGQSLTAILLHLKDIKTTLGQNPLNKDIARASEIVSHLLQEVRQRSLQLHPAVLDEVGLEAAMQWSLRTHFKNKQIQLHLDVMSEFPRLAVDIEITTYRVFQEACSNAIKYGQAKNIYVKLYMRSGYLFLSVKDDGRGFDVERAMRGVKSGESLGLATMQERVELAGGEIVIQSNPGVGTEVQMVLPIEVAHEGIRITKNSFVESSSENISG